MLTANLIMFSRSLTEDYRWIYFDRSINQILEKNILAHYENFKENKDFYLNQQHLVLRSLDNCLLVYRFIETENTDQNSRKIYALVGFVFSDIDLIIFKKIYPYVISHLFFDEKLSKEHTINISNKLFKETKSVDFDLNIIFNQYKNDECARYLADQLANVWDSHSKENIIITKKAISTLQFKPLLTLNLPTTVPQKRNEDNLEEHCTCETKVLKDDVMPLDSSNTNHSCFNASDLSSDAMAISDIENITLNISDFDKNTVIVEKKNSNLIIHFLKR